MSKLHWTRIQKRVYASDTPVTLKQGQGHQPWYRFIDPKQSCDHAKFERLCLKNVPNKKPTFKFLPNQETCKLSPLNMCENQN